MAANQGEYPKADGDIYYGQDANMSFYQGALSDLINYGNIDVLATATLIKAANPLRKSILIRNNGYQNIYVGAAGVTPATGKKIPSGETRYILDKDAIYGITDSGTVDTRYLEVQ